MDKGKKLMIDLKYVILHTPLFLGGTNLQDKIEKVKRTGIQMVYNRETQELFIKWNNEIAIIPTSNIASMIPTNPADAGMPVAPVVAVAPKVPKPAVVGKVKAQVSDPTRDPVFGPGN